MKNEQIFRRRCNKCERRTTHKQVIGKLQRDPKRAENRAYDFHPATTECLGCGRKTATRILPNLSAAFFS